MTFIVDASLTWEFYWSYVSNKRCVFFSQYTNVAAPDVFEWGYRRGNDPQHFREEYLSQKAHNFKAKLRWGDAYEGQGEQFYDYNHGGYAPKAPEYAPPVKVPSYTARR